MLDRGPVKYPSMPNQLPPIPTAGGGPEDQQMPCFGSREELGEPLKSQELEGHFLPCPSAVSGRPGPIPWRSFVRSTPLHHGARFCTPPCGGAGNVRAGTEPGARFGRADSPGAPTFFSGPLKSQIRAQQICHTAAFAPQGMLSAGERACFT